MSTRGFAPHRQTAVVQPPTAEQEPQEQEPDSTPVSSSQLVVQGTPLEQPTQNSSDTFLGADVLSCTAPVHESNRDKPDSPTLPPTTAAYSTAYISMLRGDQPSITDASRLDAPPNELGVNSVEKLRMRTAAVEATHDYRESHSPDASAISFLPISLYPRVGDGFSVSIAFR